MMIWFKLHSEIRNDPKMYELDADQRWLFVCLLCVASESPQRGTITDVRLRGLAASLRTDETRLKTTLDTLKDLKIAEYDPDARTITILNWNRRQYDHPSDAPRETAERKRKSRARHDNVTSASRVRHGTDSDTDSDSDTEVDTEIEVEPAAPVSSELTQRTEMIRQYEAVFGQTLSGPTYQQMVTYMKRLQSAHSVDWWALAITETTGARRPGWQYMKAVLESWLASGKPTTNGKTPLAAQDTNRFVVRVGNEDVYYRTENGVDVEEKRVPAKVTL